MTDANESLSKSLRERLASRSRVEPIPADARTMMLAAASEIDWLNAQLEQERIHGQKRSEEAHAVILALLGDKGVKSRTGMEVLQYFADVAGNAGFDVPDWTNRHEEATISEFSGALPRDSRQRRVEAALEE